jgi:hypothetical protein
MTMINRTSPEESTQKAFRQTEIEALAPLIKDRERTTLGPPAARHIVKLAWLGG